MRTTLQHLAAGFALVITFASLILTVRFCGHVERNHVLLSARDSVEFYRKKEAAFQDSAADAGRKYEKAKYQYDSIAALVFCCPSDLDDARDSLRAKIHADIRRQLTN
jgi:hypothetical protein